MADNDNILTLETTQGPVVIEMRPDLAPKHVERIQRRYRTLWKRVRARLPGLGAGGIHGGGNDIRRCLGGLSPNR